MVKQVYWHLQSLIKYVRFDVFVTQKLKIAVLWETLITSYQTT
jgi:hypothetical protein